MRSVLQGQHLRAEDYSGFFGKSGVFNKEPYEGYFKNYCDPVYGTDLIGFYGVEIAPYFDIDLNKTGWGWKDFYLALRDKSKMDFLLCPADEEPKVGTVIVTHPYTQWQGAYSSFLMNGNLLGKASYNKHYFSADSKKVNSPDRLMMITDSGLSGWRFTWAWGNNRTYADIAYNQPGVSRDGVALDRHLGPSENNVGFVDGHVTLATIDNFESIYITEDSKL